ncbi:TolC family protein [Paludisphaera soli]|uniref:TolC family protein n=1 Tax=Paludisphaera soli TaxID=2712865 RepID=UPI0013E9A092|nr:TolC family protein [Paludisphaera soli]
MDLRSPTAAARSTLAPIADEGDATGVQSSAARLDDPEDVGLPLEPDQEIYPIDLPGALRLAGARDLDIAIAKTRVAQAAADLSQARALWLPSIFLGPNWIRHDGQAQIVEGPVRNISKSSLFLGGTAASGSSVSGPVPAGGPAQVTGLTTVLRFSDAIFEPLAANQVMNSRKARVAAAGNDALLGVAEAYLDLQAAAGRLAIAREAATNADRLAALTGSFARSGAGLEADYRRTLAERDRRRKQIEEAVGEVEMASAELVRRTRLDPRIVVAPVEPAESVLRMVDDDLPIDDLIVAGLQNRPELAEAQALVSATLVRLKQARLRPFIPSLALRFSGGGFGGGRNDFFGDFAGRSDADVNLYWELANLGFTDRAIQRRRAAENQQSVLELVKLQDRVAAEVVRAEKRRTAAHRQMARARTALPEAARSLDLNFTNIRAGSGLPGATRPIEVLQPIQALAQARADYLDSVLSYNRAQFQLYHALGRPPRPDVEPAVPEPPATPFSPPAEVHRRSS